MKLTVFGATGRTGRHLVAAAAGRGHQVTAFTRRPAAVGDRAVLAAVVAGDGRDPEAVAKAVAGADAVVAIVSAGTRAGPHQAAEVLGRITAAMTELGVRRLVVTSAYPVVGDRPRLPMALLRRVFREAYADVAAMERVVAASDLDWTVARLNRLTDKPAAGGVRVTEGLLDRPAGLTRADAAATLLDLLEDPATARTAVNVAGPG